MAAADRPNPLIQRPSQLHAVDSNAAPVHASDTGLDGDYWEANQPAFVGVDGRAKRATPARRGTLQLAYAALTDSHTTPKELHVHLAPLAPSTSTLTYDCVVGYASKATLPLA